MDKKILVAKFAAASVSFGLWLLTLCVLGGLTYFHWYPGFLFWTDGGLRILQLICSVDVVLGPVLMFVIFSPAKPRRMKIVDVSVVIVLQLLALVFGILTVSSQAPEAVIYSAPAFRPVWGGILEAQGSSPEKLAGSSAEQPPLLFAVWPDSTDYKRVLDTLTQKGIPIYAQVRYIQPLKEHAAELFDGDAAIRKLLHDKAPALEQQLKATYPQSDAKLAWFSGRYINAVLVFDGKLELLGYLPLPDKLENPVGVPVTHIGSAHAAASAASGAVSAAAASGTR